MASGLLDDFNRANNASLGASWTADVLGAAYGSLQVLSNQAARQTSFDSNFWNTTFAADQEAYCTIVAMPSNAARLYVRLNNAGTGSVTGYEVEFDTTSSYIVRMDSSASRTTLLNLSTLFAAGDKIKIRCVGSTISVYRDTGAGFSLVNSTTDATYAGAGKIGILSQNNTALTIDDFGGGDLAGASLLPLLGVG